MKSAELTDVLKFVMIAFIGALVVVGGFRILFSVSEGACDAELNDLTLSLSDLSKQYRNGQVDELSLTVPCGADKIIVVGDKMQDPELLSTYPLVQDAVTSESGHNVFLLKEGEVLGSVSAGIVDVTYPSFFCVEPSNQATLTVQGKGKSVILTPSCQESSCTDIALRYNQEHSREVFTQSSAYVECRWCPSALRIEDEIASHQTLSDQLDVTKSVSSCDGKTSVEITITPTNTIKELRVFESLDQTCSGAVTMESLPSDQGEQLQEDALLGWRLFEVSRPVTLRYSYSDIVPSRCLENTRTAYTGEEILGTGRAHPVISDGPLEIISSAPVSVEVGTVYSYNVVTNKNVDNVRFKLENNPSSMNIQQTGQLIWIPSQSDTGTHEITVVATLKTEQVEQTFSVQVTEKPDCSGIAGRMCHEGNVWSKDHCDQPVSVLTNCVANQRCENGVCVR